MPRQLVHGLMPWKWEQGKILKKKTKLKLLYVFWCFFAKSIGSNRYKLKQITAIL